MDARVVVDASVWVSRLRPQDVNHDANRLWAERFTAAGGLLVAPTLLLIEVAAALSRQTGQTTLAKQAVEDMSSTDTMQFVPLDSTLVQAAADIAADLQLRAGDSIYVAVAHQLNIPLVSWDQEQLQRAGTLIATYTPSTYIFSGEQDEEN